MTSGLGSNTWCGKLPRETRTRAGSRGGKAGRQEVRGLSHLAWDSNVTKAFNSNLRQAVRGGGRVQDRKKALQEGAEVLVEPHPPTPPRDRALNDVFAFPASGSTSFDHRLIEVVDFKKIIIVSAGPLCSPSYCVWGQLWSMGLRGGSSPTLWLELIPQSGPRVTQAHSCLPPPGSTLPKPPDPRGQPAPDGAA